jgi:hypothetical protein
MGTKNYLKRDKRVSFRVFNLYMAMCHSVGCKATVQGFNNFTNILIPYVPNLNHNVKEVT